MKEAKLLVSILMVSLLVSIPLGFLMLQTQEQSLSKGLKDRVNVLLESISSGTKAYMPSENVLELSYLPGQSSALQEANFVTITGFKSNENENENNSLNYVWASNDENILQKIDTPELIYGESRLTIPEVDDIIKKYIMLNFDAKAKVKKTSTQISELVNEYKRKKDDNGKVSPVSH